MLIRLLLLFTLVPLAELALLLYLGQFIGWGWTIFLVGITGFLGVMLLRAQGFTLVNNIRANLDRGEVPGNHLLEGFLLLIGGLFLLTPGLITDTLGFLLLIPQSRSVLREFLKSKISKMLSNGQITLFRL